TDGPAQLQAKLAVSGHLGSTSPALIAQQGAASAQRLVEELHPARNPEAVTDFAFRLPVYVIGGLLGFAPDCLSELAAWTGDFARCLAPSSTAAELERGTAAAGSLVEAFRTLLGRPGVDAIVANRIGYLSQAYEATAGLIGNTLVALGRHGDLRSRLESTQGLLVAVVREVGRHDPP